MTASPARTSTAPFAVDTRSIPWITSVYSSNSGVCPGSIHPPGLFMRATLSFDVFEFTRPTNSSMIFGLLPAAATTVGFAMCVTTCESYRLALQPSPDHTHDVDALLVRQ